MWEQPSRDALMKGCPEKKLRKSTEEHPHQSAAPTKLPCSFTEVTL